MPSVRKPDRPPGWMLDEAANAGRENLNADPNIVGQMLRLNGKGHRVIGVMAEGVESPQNC